VFSLLWSEHCGYKHSAPLLRRLPSSGVRVLQGPGENAGVIDLGDGEAVAFKVESHNHPSAVEPFQGAATGVGGIIRDIVAMGARPVALLDGRRVVVRLDLERDRLPLAEVDHAGVLARPLEHAVALGRQTLQERRGVLVAAVLGPEQREHRELEVVRLALQEALDPVQLPVSQTEGAVHRLFRDLSQSEQCRPGVRR